MGMVQLYPLGRVGCSELRCSSEGLETQFEVAESPYVRLQCYLPKYPDFFAIYLLLW
jgi:hypothetical protein